MKKFLSVICAVTALLMLLSACGGEKASVPVQSVSMICGIGNVGMHSRFGGVVTSRGVIEIEKEENKTVDEVSVAEGDSVTAGQVLFTYDIEEASLELEKAQLELDQLKAGITAKENEKAALEKEKKSAPKSEQLSYTLEIQACDTEIRETQYNISVKEKELARLEAALENPEVTSPVDGSIRAMNIEGNEYGSDGMPKPFMEIMETGTYRVKCTVNENNITEVYEGMAVRVLSRVDGSVWTGCIESIDFESPESQGDFYMEIEEDGSRSSSYPFYIALDSCDGMLLGQHVYVEADTGEAAPEEEGIALPACWLFDIAEDGADASVWAENGRGRLEKRTVRLGGYHEDSDTWTVTGGLTAGDSIAFPDEGLSAGMACTEYNEEGFSDNGDVSGEPFYDADFYEDDGYAGADDGFFELPEEDYGEFEEAAEEEAAPGSEE